MCFALSFAIQIPRGKENINDRRDGEGGRRGITWKRSRSDEENEMGENRGWRIGDGEIENSEEGRYGRYGGRY